MGVGVVKILTSEQMRNIDYRTVSEYGIPSIVLMENAAIAVANVVCERYPDARRVAIFCGHGQNGGDGLAVARHLKSRGLGPDIFLIGDRSRFTGDAKTNLEICDRLHIPMHDIRDRKSLDLALERAASTDLVVDAIFGTGLNRPPAGLFAATIRGVVALGRPIVAVDLPSGLNGSLSELFDPVVRADVTVTFAQPKIPHVFEPASDYCGELVVVDISIPKAAIDAEDVSLSMITPGDVAAFVRPRAPASHKGTYGHVAIVAGSAGRSGAAILAARGAIRGGAGLVTVVTDADTARIVDSVSIESMTLAIERDAAKIESLVGVLSRYSALLMGPGLPDDDESYQFVQVLSEAIDRPLVLDASALNAFRGDLSALNPRGESRVITPHPGELARLLDTSTSKINQDRIGAARMTAKNSRCVVILKGRRSVVAHPAGLIALNPTGNPGMASGGMGDVLAGLVTAFLGVGWEPFDAARAAVYLHGLAGNLLRDETSDIGMTAMDLADRIPHAINKVRASR